MPTCHLRSNRRSSNNSKSFNRFSRHLCNYNLFSNNSSSNSKLNKHKEDYYWKRMLIMEHRNSKLSYNHRNNHNKHSRSSNSSRNSIINYCFNSNNNNNNCNQSYSNLLNNLVECSISNQMANSHSFPWHTHSSNKSQIFLRTYNNRCKNQLK